jgi:hypothetical protein
MSGRKDDGGKDRWDLAPWAAFGQIIKVLTFGAKKYDGWNWAAGIKYSRVRAALQRHLAAWDAGIALDEETGLPHLAHAGCCLVFLLTFELFPARYKEWDDRYIFEDTEASGLEPRQKGWREEAMEGSIMGEHPEYAPCYTAPEDR